MKSDKGLAGFRVMIIEELAAQPWDENSPSPLIRALLADLKRAIPEVEPKFVSDQLELVFLRIKPGQDISQYMVRVNGMVHALWPK